jgi:hypothetical protein
MKPLATLIAVLALTVATAAQGVHITKSTTKCTVPMNLAPTPGGLRLGMTTKEVQSYLKVTDAPAPDIAVYSIARFQLSDYFKDKWERKDPTLLALIKEKAKGEGDFATISVDLGQTALIVRRNKAPMLREVNFVALGFYKDKLINIDAEYDPIPLYAKYSETQFLAALATRLNIPRTTWEGGADEFFSKCNGFDMMIARHDDKISYWMVVSDTTANQAVKDDLENTMIRMYEQRSKN